MTFRGRWFELGVHGRRAVSSWTIQPFAEFYVDHASAVLRYFVRHTGDVHGAFDLTAETFAKAYEKRSKFRGSSEQQAAAWLWAIARNELAMFRRSRVTELRALTRLGLERPEPNDEELRQIEQISAVEEAQEHVADALQALPAEQREVLQLRFVEHLSYEEIAWRLEVSPDVVRARTSRGLRTLRVDERIIDAAHMLEA